MSWWLGLVFDTVQVLRFVGGWVGSLWWFVCGLLVFGVY